MSAEFKRLKAVRSKYVIAYKSVEQAVDKIVKCVEMQCSNSAVDKCSTIHQQKLKCIKLYFERVELFLMNHFLFTSMIEGMEMDARVFDLYNKVCIIDELFIYDFSFLAKNIAHDINRSSLELLTDNERGLYTKLKAQLLYIKISDGMFEAIYNKNVTYLMRRKQRLGILLD